MSELYVPKTSKDYTDRHGEYITYAEALFTCRNPLEVKTLFTEALLDINKDITFLYNKYFLSFITKLLNNKISIKDDYSYDVISSDTLISKESKLAHKVNPIKIFIGVYKTGSGYYATAKQLQLSLNPSIIQIISGVLKPSSSMSENEKERLSNMLSAEVIKGSIYHELSHWVDDTKHNFHITKSLELGELSINNSDYVKKVLNKNKSKLFLTKMEISAQVHSIKAFKDIYVGSWDKLTMSILVQRLPIFYKFFKYLFSQNDKKELKEYQRSLFTRLSRENLLGKKMKPVNLSDIDKLK